MRAEVLIATGRDAGSLEWRFGFDLGRTVLVGAPDLDDDPPADDGWPLFRQGEPGLTCLRDDRLEPGGA